MTRESDAALARRLATEAGSLLVTLRAVADDSGGALGALGDRQAHEFLGRELRTHRPRDAVLSEEGTDDTARPRAERVWIVDPLDGSREYAEPGRTDWAVHVALWCSDRPAAPVAVATAAGLHASRLDGAALAYNRADPLLPDLIVCRPELAEPLLAAVAREPDGS